MNKSCVEENVCCLVFFCFLFAFLYSSQRGLVFGAHCIRMGRRGGNIYKSCKSTNDNDSERKNEYQRWQDTKEDFPMASNIWENE